jgi:hypothetical protein
LRLLGSDHVVERRPEEQLTRNLLPAKVLLHYRSIGVVVVFVDPGGRLPPWAPVSVVGVEQSGSFCTADGLRVGLPMAWAEKIVSAGYSVLRRSPYCVEVVAADGGGENYLAIHPEDDRVAFIGLHRRDDQS